MKKILQYGRHLLRAKGRHGTHSPFVYAFVEQVMRARPPRMLPSQDQFGPRAAGLLYQTLRYLAPPAIYADPSLYDAVTAIVSLALPGVVVHSWTAGTIPAQTLLLCRIGTELPGRLEVVLAQPAKVLLLQPHAGKVATGIWEQLAAWPTVKISLDYWHFGLLVNDGAFKARQHFSLR
ncbi:hypothetical protein [Taibaiella koreensis]|uniref:hypothetical protein n=1 Tax=Taibaiella koreensis TaxID=1268548 RepID=UPI000E59D5F6|nr:hypothetical protein [Taibaiella koreensis]